MRRTLNVLMTTLCAAALLAAPASAHTLPEALAMAINNNPTLEDARLGVNAAREDRNQARAQFLPNVNANLQYGSRHLESDRIGFFGPSSTSVELSPGTYSVQGTQPLYAGGRLGAQMDLADAAVSGSRYNYRNTEQDILLQVIASYAETLRDQEVVRLREINVRNLETQLSGAQRRLQVGEVTRTDVSQAQARLAGARSGLAQARSQLAATRARYAEIVGVAPDALAPALTPANLPRSLDEAQARAIASHPAVLQSQENVEAARARTRIERAAMRPQLNFVGRLERQQEEAVSRAIDDSWDAYAQLSIPLFEGGYRSARVRQGRINVNRAQALTDAQRRAAERRSIMAWNDYGAAQQQADAAREQVSANQDALSGAEREQGLGLRTTIEVLNAQQELLDAQIALAAAEARVLVASYALLASTGDLTLTSAPGSGAQRP